MALEANLPKMVLVEQVFENNPIADVPGALREKIESIKIQERIQPGQSVAITAGSRGITDQLLVIKILVAELIKIGTKPFIIPAMGSHGGATDQGQESILKEYGITCENLGVPVRSNMEVDIIGKTIHGVPVYVDRNANTADHIVLLNRVKPHTDFEGEIESGLTKMAAIGLGKRHGAEAYHNAILDQGYYETFTTVADVILEKAPVTLGLGIVENQLDQTEEIGIAWKENIPSLDRELLVKAKSVFPRLPFEEIDLLIVDEMGKNISGTGMDQNIIARTVIKVGTVPQRPKIRRIFVRDLTSESQGSAIGLANADFTTTNLINKIDRHATYTNCLCSCEPSMAAVPAYFDTDKESIVTALKTIGLKPPEKARVVHIKNTLHLEKMNISTAILEECQKGNLKIHDEVHPLLFDEKGKLKTPW